MRDGEPQVYAALASFRNGYVQSQWGRIQITLVFNVVAMPYVFVRDQSDTIKLLVCLAALVFHLVILNGTLRADGWIKFFEQKMGELEKLDRDSAGVRVPVFSGEDFMARKESKFTTRKVVGPFGIGLILAWIIFTFREILLLLA